MRPCPTMWFGRRPDVVPPQVWLKGTVALTTDWRSNCATRVGLPLSEGLADIISATTPATCGVAMLVPLMLPYLLLRMLERTLTPGALRSGLIVLLPITGPRLEKLARLSLVVPVAPTTQAEA